jgi:hypothetical protein
MSTTLQERNRWLYVVYTDNDHDQPIRRSLWYPLKLWAPDFRRYYGEDKIGQPLTSMHDGWYRDADGLRYQLPDGGKTTPEFSETEPIPPPVQRGKKLPVRYYQGVWQKQTARRGWTYA